MNSEFELIFAAGFRRILFEKEEYKNGDAAAGRRAESDST
jgi:hypothetical protein